MDLSADLFVITHKSIGDDLFNFKKDRIRYFLSNQVKCPLPWECLLHSSVIDVACDLRVKAGVFRRNLSSQGGYPCCKEQMGHRQRLT